MQTYQFKTDRLDLRPTGISDAAFILELMNSPGWLANIGDRGVYTEADAVTYIQEKMLPQVERLGYGNFTVIRRADGQKLGTVGLYDRAGMEGLDIGFAFLPGHQGQGYAYEAASKLHQVAQETFGLDRLSAITLPTNWPSQRLLERLGLSFSHRVVLPGDTEELLFYEQIFSPAPTQRRTIHQYRGGQMTTVSDVVAEEAPLQIQLCAAEATPPLPARDLSITMRTPGHDEDLAVGFLWTEGILPERAQLDRVAVTDDQVLVTLNTTTALDLSQLERHFYTSSSCGVCGKASVDAIQATCPWPIPSVAWQVPMSVLHALPEQLRASQGVFDQTGGIHAAALFDDEGKLLALREDVGRHNALDKLIGHFVRTDHLPLGQHLLLLSGRASFELIQKAAMAGIALVAAIGAPSCLAVSLAEERGITLVGFLSDQRANVYTHPERIEY